MEEQLDKLLKRQDHFYREINKKYSFVSADGDFFIPQCSDPILTELVF